MRREQFNWRNALIALGSLALLTIGLGIIVYVGLARERISPTPTAIAARPTLVGGAKTPSPSPTAPVRVLGVVREYSPGALIIVLAPTEGAVEQVIVVENVQVLFGDGRLASPRDIAPGATILAEGTLDPLGRLIAERIVISEGPPPTAAPTPPPSAAPPTSVAVATATVTPVSSIPLRAWLGEYFGNPSLQGAPTVVRSDAAIDFQWGEGAPALGIARDSFSVRWRGRWPLEEGGYRFYAYADDGVRVWIDGALVIDNWRDQGPTLTFGDQYLATGEHTIQVEYYDRSDNAQVRVWWEFKGLYPDWRGEYYPNRNLTGAPVLTRNDTAIDFDWGPGSPGPGVPADNFSVRWTRTLEMEGGSYRFYANADDGIRVWVDSPLIIDQWDDATAMTHSGDILLDGGPHSLRIEYNERTGHAAAQVWWERIDQFPDWRGEYFPNGQLSGRPAFVRNDANIDMDWGTGSPGGGVPADEFSVRWTRQIPLEAANYRFWVVADDGARVLVNGAMLIDAWSGSGGVQREAPYAATAGQYTIVVEYHEVGGGASIRMGWERLAPTATLTTAPPTLTSTLAPGAPTPTPTTASTVAPTATSATAPLATPRRRRP